MSKITEQEKQTAREIAEKASQLSKAQQIRVLGVIEGIGLAATVEKAGENTETA